MFSPIDDFIKNWTHFFVLVCYLLKNLRVHERARREKICGLRIYDNSFKITTSYKHVSARQSLNSSANYTLQDIFDLFHACDSRTHEAAPFQNIFRFCTFLPNFSNILPFFALFLENRTHALTF